MKKILAAFFLLIIVSHVLSMEEAPAPEATPTPTTQEDISTPESISIDNDEGAGYESSDGPVYDDSEN